MITNPKLSRSSKFEMGRTKKEETLEAMGATGKNPEKSFLELQRLCRQLKIYQICVCQKQTVDDALEVRTVNELIEYRRGKALTGCRVSAQFYGKRLFINASVSGLSTK